MVGPGVPGESGPGVLRARLTAVETAAADAERDLAALLTRPTLFDATVPATADFRRALERARRRLSEADASGSWLAVEAVADLEEAWRRATDQARAVGLAGFSPRQRRRVCRAHRLLEQARSDRGSPASRLAGYHRALVLLDGLVPLPDLARHELREAARSHPGPAGPSGPGFATWS